MTPAQRLDGACSAVVIRTGSLVIAVMAIVSGHIATDTLPAAEAAPTTSSTRNGATSHASRAEMTGREPARPIAPTRAASPRSRAPLVRIPVPRPAVVRTRTRDGGPPEAVRRYPPRVEGRLER
jgi:hypothetical protein